LARNAQIVNALGMIPEAVKMWGRDNAASLKSQTIGQDRNTWLSGLSRGARLLTQVSMLGWGAYLALDGHLTGGMVIASSIIGSRALAPVEGTIEGWRHWSQCRSSWGRITGLLINSPLNIDRLRLPSPQGRLDVERLLYVPQTTKKVVLNGISFSLKPGEQLGIIGSSGAGKTTLGKMLVASFSPTAGNVKLDMMDLRNWDQRQLGENIGYLPQDVQLFPASIKANIGRMRDDASDEDVYEAAALAGIHELVASFPQGYETLIAVDGAPLSGGQKQRIGLARAFFGNPRLVVLDEPNSNLDTAGEKALADAMKRAREKGTTIVAITQRHSLLQHVDRIMVVENGAVAAIGERSKMLAAITGRKQAPASDNGRISA
ncbi:MAG: ATP-binding cassette domain-containing protein, partial [Nisaea sp.]